MIQLASLLLTFTTLMPPADQRTPQGWHQDLAVLADTLRARHPKLLVSGARAEFDRQVAAARQRLTRASRPEAIAELARVVASLRDGHSQVGLVWDDAIGFRSLPIRLYLFDDGVDVIRAAGEGERLLGGRVERIGAVSIDSAVARLRPWVHGDNESSFRDIVASRLILAELLAVAGISPTADSVRLDVRRADGQLVSAWLKPAARGAPQAWRDAREAGPAVLAPPPGNPPLWYRGLDSLGVFWISFTAVANTDSVTLAELAARALAAAERSSATKLVVDIRRNNGGDNTLLRPLLVGLVRSRFNARGHLYAVIGRLTFSAAMNFATRLEQYTEVIFVGEPTGAPPNHYGETQRLRLPFSGVTVLFSALHWQDSDPRDARPWIEPAIRVPLRFDDYRRNRDAALDSIAARP